MKLYALDEIDEKSVGELPEQSEESAQQMVVSVLALCRSFLDTRPWGQVGFILSRRAENVLRRNHAQSVSDVRKLLTQAQSHSGVVGAGILVQSEWKRLLAA